MIIFYYWTNGLRDVIFFKVYSIDKGKHGYPEKCAANISLL